MEELATLIQEIGLDTLQQQLGLDLSFGLEQGAEFDPASTVLAASVSAPLVKVQEPVQNTKVAETPAQKTKKVAEAPRSVQNTAASDDKNFLSFFSALENTDTSKIEPFISANDNIFSFFSGPQSEDDLTYSSDFIAETRAYMADILPTLREVAADPIYLAAANSIIRKNMADICVADLQEGIAGIETASRLLESVEGDINALLAQVNTFKSYTDPATIIRESGSLLRTLKPFVDNIANIPFACSIDSFSAATTGEAEASPDFPGSSLARLEAQLEKNDFIELTEEGREQLQRGTTMLGRLATFQQQLGPVVAQFENVCGAEGKFNVDSISAIGDLILKMSDLFGNGDGATTRGASYVNNVVVRRCYFLNQS